MRPKFFYTCFFLLPLFILAQDLNNFAPHHSKVNADSLKMVLKANRDSYMKSIQKEDPHIITILRNEYDERIAEIVTLCKNNYLFWDDTLASYLKSVVRKLQNGSPFIKKDIVLMLTKTVVPNAGSWGDNVVIINTGLITRYENEAELAFVIGHELAHDYLDHIFKGDKLEYELTKQLKFNRKFRRAQRAKYQTSARVSAVLEEYLGAVNSFSRKDELQADSLGAVLIKNAGYSFRNAVNSLAILEHVDDAFFSENLQLKKIFSGNVHPFNDKWLQQENLSDMRVYRETLSDSLSTHPICRERMRIMTTAFKVDTNSKIPFSPDIDYFNQKAYFEDTQVSFEDKNYMLALYHALQLLQKYPKNTYLVSTVCASFYHISYALQKHRFSYYVPLPHPDFDPDLNQLIAFLNNLSYSDYKKLALQFYDKYSADLDEDIYLANAKYYCEAMDRPEAALAQEINAFNKNAKDKRFEDILNEIGHEKK